MHKVYLKLNHLEEPPVSGIVNGIFSGRSALNSHGEAMGAIGDNIANANTPGYKTARAEFEDIIAGGSAPGRTIGSGSNVSAITQIFQQGTLESTGRPLDIGIDGNGYFVVAKDAQRFYTRAGNFKVDAAGFIVTQNNMAVLGFPAGGSGALAPINVNTVEQSSVSTKNVTISGNVNASSSRTINLATDIPDTTTSPPSVTYAQLSDLASYSTVVDIFDSLGEAHTATFYFFKDSSTANTYEVRGYVNNEDVDTAAQAGGLSGYPRPITDGSAGSIPLTFGGDGIRNNLPSTGTPDLAANITWTNGADPSPVNIKFDPFTQYSAANNILSITQDGKGVGAVTNLNIQDNGTIFALLSNGQSATIGTIGLVNFANTEGLTRVGKNLLVQSPQSGEPIVGEPTSGTFGSVKSGTIELSTVDIADQFVKLVSLQRGFQANAKVITTINQLLNEVIQLV